MTSLPLPDPDLVLAFVNTRTRDDDHLATAEAATRWATAISSLARSELTADDLPRLRELREMLGHLFDDGGAESIAGVNNLLAGVHLDCRLDAAGGAAYSVDIDADDAAGAIEQIVLASLMLLAEGPGLGSVRQCAASDCTIRFSSPNARRVWCDTSTCGNRERARRHYRRRTAADDVQSRGKKP